MRAISLALLIVGAVLLVLAAYSGDSISDSFSRVFRGQPDAKTLALMVGGALAVLFGLVGVLRPARG